MVQGFPTTGPLSLPLTPRGRKKLSLSRRNLEPVTGLERWDRPGHMEGLEGLEGFLREVLSGRTENSGEPPSNIGLALPPLPSALPPFKPLPLQTLSSYSHEVVFPPDEPFTWTSVFPSKSSRLASLRRCFSFRTRTTPLRTSIISDSQSRLLHRLCVTCDSDSSSFPIDSQVFFGFTSLDTISVVPLDLRYPFDHPSYQHSYNRQYAFRERRLRQGP